MEISAEWAINLDLPVIIHSRESLDLNIDIITNHQNGQLKGIFHCFGGDYDQAMRIHNLGFKIGIGGVITFKNSGLSNLLPRLPREMIVLDTEKVAISLNIPLLEVSSITTRNAKAVFEKKG